jgi:branched-chain amino acid transport system ATP-binding protein
MLEVNNLNVCYGRVQALRGVSLAVGDNEAVAVLGANGAGKSSLIKTIMGWQRPVDGEICFSGETINHLSVWDRVAQGIALVPEGGRVFRDLSVLDNLRLGAYLQPEAAVREQMEVVFELFPTLAERESQIAKTLSGGEQQMLAIGRAMMSRPKLLLIDEVSMGLMPILVKRVFSVIKDLREHGVSILLVEQNAFEALKVVDRAYVLENGRIVLAGTPDQLREDARVKAAYLGG